MEWELSWEPAGEEHEKSEHVRDQRQDEEEERSQSRGVPTSALWLSRGPRMSVSTMARVGVGKLSCRLALQATSTTVSLSLVLPKLPIKSESLSELWSLGCSWSSMLRNLISSCTWFSRLNELFCSITSNGSAWRRRLRFLFASNSLFELWLGEKHRLVALRSESSVVLLTKAAITVAGIKVQISGRCGSGQSDQVPAHVKKLGRELARGLAHPPVSIHPPSFPLPGTALVVDLHSTLLTLRSTVAGLCVCTFSFLPKSPSLTT